MATSPLFNTIIDSIPTSFNAPEHDVSTVRKVMAPMHGHPLREDTIATAAVMGDQAAKWVTAANVDKRGWHALFCHGGGFVSCRMNEYLFWGEFVSQYLNAKVLVPDYRLAPENPYPAALDDCVSAWRAMLDSGIDPDKVFFTGDSCGGGLALSTMLRARDEGLPLPACYLGLTAWYDLTLPGQSGIDPGGKDPFITPGWYRARAKDYLGEVKANTAYASPVYADCSGLPPMLLQVGAVDITRDSAIDMARAAGLAGVHVELQICEGMVHGFHGLVGSGVEESIAAWHSARQFVERHII